MSNFDLQRTETCSVSKEGGLLMCSLKCELMPSGITTVAGRLRSVKQDDNNSCSPKATLLNMSGKLFRIARSTLHDLSGPVAASTTIRKTLNLHG